MKKLFTVNYGSKLYGTNVPTSDVDLKHVVLPDLTDLLLCKKIKNEVIKTNKEKFTKNSAEDVDEEFIPIQVFANDFLSGQTYSLELAYAVDYTKAGQQVFDSEFVTFCHELREKFLTSNMSALTGYAVNQASLYSFKGERLNASREVWALFKTMADKFGGSFKPLDFTIIFEQLAADIVLKFPKYVQLTQYAVDNKGNMRPCLKLLEKVIPYTSTFDHSLTVVEGNIKKYGSRADAASVDNVDWKASMHALRVVEEGIALLKNRLLVFPFPPDYAEFLLQIKHGELPYKQVINIINARLDLLKTLEAESALPKKSPELLKELDAFLLGWLKHWYSV